MKQKIIGILSLMTVMLFAFATAAFGVGDFIIQNSTLDQIFTVNGTTSDVFSVGEIYENGTALKEVYWQIASVAIPSSGDTTHLSTADQIYNWVIGLNYITADAELNLVDTYIFVGNGTGKAVGVAVSGDITIDNAGVVSVVNTAGLDASNITSGTIDNARITLVEDEIPSLTSSWANDMNATKLVGLDALNYQILSYGENITGGTVAAARIDAAITRDTEVITLVEGWGYWNESTDVGDDEINESSIKFNQTCDAGNHLYISGTDLACESDADTTYTANTPLNLTGTVFDLIDCADNQIYKMDGTTWTCEADAGAGIEDIVEDTTPQLGGNLDMNGFSIEEPGSTNMTIDVSGNFIIVLA